MVLQCPGWRRGSGDGRTRLMVMEGTRLTGLTSRRHPGRARVGHPSPFRGFRRPVLFQGCGVRAVREWAAQCRGADTGLTAK
jgi:hypothetical protein